MYWSKIAATKKPHIALILILLILTEHFYQRDRFINWMKENKPNNFDN